LQNTTKALKCSLKYLAANNCPSSLIINIFIDDNWYGGKKVYRLTTYFGINLGILSSFFVYALF